MKPWFPAAAVLSAAVWLAGCVGGELGAPLDETIDESRPLSAHGELSLENVNGKIRLTTWDEPRVRIEATKSAGSRRALAALTVAIEGEADRVSIRTGQPRGGFWFGRGGGVRYDLTVPRGARVSVRNVNGSVEIDGLAGALRASTVNGSVEGHGLGGEVEASTTNGSVEIELVRVDAAARNRLTTTNGAVRLVLPTGVGADLEARTVNGRLQCEFDLGPGAEIARRRLEGRIGAGGARFELRTVNGSVHIDRGLAVAAGPGARPQAEATAAPSPAR